MTWIVKRFFEFTDYDGTINSYKKMICSLYAAGTQSKNVLLIEDMHQFGILSYHN